MICHGRLVGSLLLLFLMSACGGAHNGWKSFPVPLYVEQSLTSSQTFNSDFQDAMAFWENKAGKKLFDYKGAWSGQNTPYVGSPSNPESVTNNVVFFQTPWPFASTIVGQTMVTSASTEIQAAMIMINPSTSFCAGDCIGQSNRTSERKVLAHELGHFLGLNHVQDTANLMYPESLPGGSLDAVTIDDVTFKSLTVGDGG
jgi:hypothetical protein